eukprot:gnl/TRDRNA2_/TRDRNA2_150859_c0_seq1.p1 gnl/TRDRNA2_/TRDRNA2_150859_c0~~gnl/TRDRNA2_/TRDRNA2_150859_c0_seq1.p1  ORF type:complete len:452 (-),score=68.18 gnl/TRDRNA2_/TRDRNA2_150859_c0_seq1:300-1592(-)
MAPDGAYRMLDGGKRSLGKRGRSLIPFCFGGKRAKSKPRHCEEDSSASIAAAETVQSELKQLQHEVQGLQDAFLALRKEHDRLRSEVRGCRPAPLPLHLVEPGRSSGGTSMDSSVPGSEKTLETSKGGGAGSQKALSNNAIPESTGLFNIDLFGPCFRDEDTEMLPSAEVPSTLMTPSAERQRPPSRCSPPLVRSTSPAHGLVTDVNPQPPSPAASGRSIRSLSTTVSVPSQQQRLGVSTSPRALPHMRENPMEPLSYPCEARRSNSPRAMTDQQLVEKLQRSWPTNIPTEAATTVSTPASPSLASRTASLTPPMPKFRNSRGDSAAAAMEQHTATPDVAPAAMGRATATSDTERRPGVHADGASSSELVAPHTSSVSISSGMSGRRSEEVPWRSSRDGGVLVLPFPDLENAISDVKAGHIPIQRKKLSQ